MAKSGNKSLSLNSRELAIDPRVWAIATELNNRLTELKKRTGSVNSIGKVTPADMKFITRFLETGDPGEAAVYAYPHRNFKCAAHKINAGKQTLERPLVKSTIGEIMKEEEKFSDNNIMEKAADLFYNPENESTSVAMFGHIARIKGWNAPEKAVNVNINKDISRDSSDEDLLATIDTIIGGEESSIHGEPHGTEEGGTPLSDELAS